MHELISDDAKRLLGDVAGSPTPRLQSWWSPWFVLNDPKVRLSTA